MDPVSSNPAEILAKIPFFAKLNAEQIAALAALAKFEHHHPLSQIVKQGDLGNRFFVITSGRVSMRRTTAGGAEASIGVIAPHSHESNPKNLLKNYFGEQMFSSQEPYDFHADAIDDVDAFRIHRKDFDELVEKHPAIHRALDFIKVAERRRRKGLDEVAEGESVTLVARKHWWALVVALAPLVLPLIVLLFVPSLLRYFSASQYELPAVGIPLLLMALFAALQVLDFYNDEYVVTNQRVAHVERNLYLQQEMRDTAPIDKVQGVMVQRQGLIGVLLGVATLVVQTPGRAEGNVTFENIGNSSQVRAAILKQQEANRARMAAESREQFRVTVRGELRHYLSPDSVPAEIKAPPARHKKKRMPGILGDLAHLVSAPFELEFHYEDRIVWRKHWVLFLRRSQKWLLSIAGVLVLFGIVTFVSGPNGACLVASLVLCAGLLLPVIYQWIDWSNDTYAVTETQIIDSERAPFGLTERTTVAPLDQITDIVVDMPNIVATVLKFGNLKIDTAGKTGQMIFEWIHEPREAQEEIYRRITEYKQKRAREDASIRSSSVVDAIIAYHRLQDEIARENEAQAQQPTADAEPSSDEAEARDWTSDEPKPGSESAA